MTAPPMTCVLCDPKLSNPTKEADSRVELLATAILPDGSKVSRIYVAAARLNSYGPKLLEHMRQIQDFIWEGGKTLQDCKVLQNELKREID